VGWICPAGGATANNKIFVYNYAIGGWAIWTLSRFNVASCMVGLTPSTLIPRLYFGGTNGYAYSGDQTNKADENSDAAYSFKVKSPAHMRMPGKDELTEASFQAVTSIIRPTGNVECTLASSIDGRAQSNTISLVGGGGGDLIGVNFIIGVSTIAAESLTSVVPQTVEDRGRVIQNSWAQGGLNEDMELAGYAIDYIPAETVSRETT
jgi:hypothetical protein